jgi:hypothetical protein
MAELTMGNRTYQIVGTDATYASSVVAKRRCAILISFEAFAKTHLAALKALNDAGRDILDCNYEVHLLITCEQCQHSLTSHGLGMLYMFQMPNVKFGGIAGGGVSQKVSQMQEGQCPSCGHPQCYLLYDPDGFPKA